MIHLLKFLVGILAIWIYGVTFFVGGAVMSILLWDATYLESALKTQDYLFKIVFGIKDVE